MPPGSVVKNPPAMQETPVWSLGCEALLEKKMVTHSSILTWKIPWTEEPGGLQPMGSLRVRNDSVHWHAHIWLELDIYRAGTLSGRQNNRCSLKPTCREGREGEGERQGGEAEKRRGERREEWSSVLVAFTAGEQVTVPGEEECLTNVCHYIV